MSTNNDNVVSTTDVAPKKEPKSFKDLNKAELVAAAVAFGTETEGNVKVLREDLEENGVTWEQYMAMFHPEKKAEKEPEKFELPEPADVNDWPDEEVDTVSEIITQEAVPMLTPQQKYLIKMTRQNPYFEFEDKKFTQENPYAIMNADQAQRILEKPIETWNMNSGFNSRRILFTWPIQVM